MTEGTAISALQSALNQSRDARRKIEARIAEIEAELKALHAQQISIASVIEQTESALRRALFPSDAPVERYQAENYQPGRPPADLEISAPPQRHIQTSQQPQYQQPREERYAQPNYQSGHQQPQYQVAQDQASQYQMAQIEEQVAKARRSEQSSNVRFNDFRIPQAATIVLREASGPLHVNEIYRRMAEGGFEFRGQHQLITLAVSLTRSKRFRKVAPGTFELSPEFLAGQVA
ncbi:MAG TPA: hypothetical protein VFD58_30950 [Blastocatellia bacterium]|nr:hypothetical protein [Blastocatellia bacterium]